MFSVIASILYQREFFSIHACMFKRLHNFILMISGPHCPEKDPKSFICIPNKYSIFISNELRFTSLIKK